jgi:hypothetical protein
LLPNVAAGGTGNFGFYGNYTSSFNGDVYSFLSLLGGDNSNNWTNWSGTDFTKNGITATSFGIYVFALSGPLLGPNGLIDIHFTGTVIPKGTFVIAYGEKCSLSNNGCFYSTPFTEAGLSAGTTSVPEPASLILLGSGLAGLGAWRLKRKVVGKA